MHNAVVTTPGATGCNPHDKIASIIRSFSRVSESTLCGSVSSHAVSVPFTFSNLSKLFASLKSIPEVKQDQIFLGASENGVRISVCFNYKAPEVITSKKRKLDNEQEERTNKVKKSVVDAIAQVKKQRKDLTTETEQETENTIMAILSNVRGPGGEQAVESWGLSSQNNISSSLAPKMVLSIRIAHGIAVSLPTLKRSFGKNWTDGVVTLSSLAHTIPVGLTLPTSEHGSVQALSGCDSLIVFASIAESS